MRQRHARPTIPSVRLRSLSRIAQKVAFACPSEPSFSVSLVRLCVSLLSGQVKTMRLSEGQLVAWELTAAVLAAVDPDELELLPEIITSVHAPSGKIGGVPGAWDFDLMSVHSLAVFIFGVAVTCIQAGVPTLFDAAIEVGRDKTKKMVDRYLERAPKVTKEESDRVPDAAHMHELIRKSYDVLMKFIRI